MAIEALGRTGKPTLRGFPESSEELTEWVFVVAMKLLARPEGQVVFARMLGEQGWICTPPKAAQTAPRVRRKKGGR